MDRLKITLSGCGLALLIGATGCKSTHSSVPPGPPYSNDGRKAPPIGFSGESHPLPANANPALGLPPASQDAAVGAMGGMPAQFGTPSPNAGNYGAPTGGHYGPPGSAGLGGSPAAPGLNSPLAPMQPTTALPGMPAGPGAGALGQPGTP